MPLPIPLPKSFARLDPIPLDDKTVFDTRANLESYALNTPNAYAGMICSVSGINTPFIINSNKSVSPFILNGGNSLTQAITIGTNDNFNFNLETNGATRLTITNGGNVGINTQTPNEVLTVSGNVSAQTLVQAGSAIRSPMLLLTGPNATTNSNPVTGNAIVIKGGNIRIDGADLSNVVGITNFDTDGQSLFDLRSASENANYNLSIASARDGTGNVGSFMKFFGGRSSDPNPFIVVKKNQPLRFATFNDFYNSDPLGLGFQEHARIDTQNRRFGVMTQAPNKPLTVTGDISSTAVVFAGSPINTNSSDQWYTAFTTTSANSANWVTTYTTVCANSASWGAGGGGGASLATVTNYLSTSNVLLSSITITDTVSAASTNLRTSFNLGSATGNYSFAVARGRAFGPNSYAEGTNSIASGDSSHAEGDTTRAAGLASHAEGVRTLALGDASHAEGAYTAAMGLHSHATGLSCTAVGPYSYTEGHATMTGQILGFSSYTAATRVFTFASGISSQFDFVTPGTILRGIAANLTTAVSKIFTITVQNRSPITGNITATADVIGSDLPNFTGSFILSGFSFGAHAEGLSTVASGSAAHAEGVFSQARADGSHAQGYFTRALGQYSHSEGNNTLAMGNNSHAEGNNTLAMGNNSHAQGDLTSSFGRNSFTFGHNNFARADGSVAGGSNAEAIHPYSFIWTSNPSSGTETTKLSTERDYSFQVATFNSAGPSNSMYGGTVFDKLSAVSLVRPEIHVAISGQTDPSTGINYTNTTNAVERRILWNNIISNKGTMRVRTPSSTGAFLDWQYISFDSGSGNIVISYPGLYRFDVRYASYDMYSGSTMRVQLLSSTNFITTNGSGSAFALIDSRTISNPTSTNGHAAAQGSWTGWLFPGVTTSIYVVASFYHTGAVGNSNTTGYPVFDNSVGTQPYLRVERLNGSISLSEPWI